jgi:hypothetical protein
MGHADHELPALWLDGAADPAFAAFLLSLISPRYGTCHCTTRPSAATGGTLPATSFVMILGRTSTIAQKEKRCAMVAKCLAAGLVEGKNLGASKDGDWLWIFGLRGDSGYLSTFNPSSLSETALRAADGNDGKSKQNIFSGR